MTQSPARFYTAAAGGFLLLQGTSTLAFRLIPALDRAFPALLGVTRMIPPHSILHILSGVLALIVLRSGGARGSLRFAAGFGAFYFGLALVGLKTGHPKALGLQAFDHPIHFLLGGLGILAVGLEAYRARPGRRASRLGPA